MTFGYLAKNDNGSVILSDKTYNCAYKGKATFIRAFWFNSGRARNGGLGVPDQYFELYQMRFTATNGSLVIPFCYSPWPNFTGIAYYTKSGNVYDFYVISQVAQTPTVYCFEKHSDNGKTGWGMSIFAPNGETMFTTNTVKPLFVERVFNADTLMSNVAVSDYFSKNIYRGVTFNSIKDNTQIITSGNAITKPAILFTSFGTATAQKDNFTGAFFESAARFNNTTGFLQTHWGIVALNPPNTRQTPARNELALVIDGADYD